MKKKISIGKVLLCLMLIVFQVLSSPINAQAASDEIGVNGEQMSASNKTVQCGEGTAVYDEATQTLTLNNATITKAYKATKTGIYANIDLKIVLNGENVINNDASLGVEKGISILGKGVDISGTGSLSVDVESNAIESFSSFISISGCDIDVKSSINGIYANTEISIEDANIYASGKNGAIKAYAETGVVNIVNSEIEAISSNGNAISGKKLINIDNCQVIANGKTQAIMTKQTGDNGNVVINESTITSKGETSYGIYAHGNMTITDSAVKVESYYSSLLAKQILISSSEIDVNSNDLGIYAMDKMTLENESSIKTESLSYGIYASKILTIENAEVDAVSSSNIAVFSPDQIIMSQCDIHAKGGNDKAAIAARVVKVHDEAANSKIVSTLKEKNDGKIAFTDWFEVTVSDNIQKRNWTSFIAKDDTELKISNGSMTNALNEVFLSVPYKVSFDLQGGQENNFEVTVYPGAKISAPTNIPTMSGKHFSGWYLNGNKFDFEDTAITSDLTLKANFTTHIPNADDGDCTTPIKCSTCDTITTEAKTHNWTLECSKDNHWYKCQNASCNVIKDKVAHIPGEEATKDHAQLCTVCGYEIESKLPDGTVIVDKATGVKAEYVDGTKFDMSIRLKVTRITPTRLNELNTVINKLEPKHSLAELYDVKLLMNGVEIQPSGKLKITIPMNEKMKSMSDLKVIYVDDNGNVTVIPSEVRNNTIIFITDHFSHYGVIGVEKTNPLTGDNMNIALLSTLLVSGFIIAFVNIKRKKMN